MFKGSKPLFQSPLVVFECPDARALNPLLIDEFRLRQRASAGSTRSNMGGWHSETDLFERREPATLNLARFILTSLAQAENLFASSENAAAKEIRLEGWININQKGAFNAPHAHPGFAWSGCYYVTQPHVETGRSGMIEFLDPRSGISGWPMTKSELTSSRLLLRPNPGTLLIFPAYLVHWVYPNESDEERITVAFNARFEPSAENRVPQIKT